MTAPRRSSALARWLLQRALPADIRDSVADDLEELYSRDLGVAGAGRARLRHWRRVLSCSARFLVEWPREIGISGTDVKLGVRMLRKYPGLSLVGGLGIAVAVAIGTVTFAFFYTYVFPTLPLEQGDRVVGIENWDTEWRNQEHRSIHDLATWRRELTSLEDVGGFRTIKRNLVVSGVQAERVAVAEMTASGFSLARVSASLGRPLLEADERKGADRVVVIGYDIWQRRFGSDPMVIGRTLQLGSLEYRVVGVMPEDFGFPLNHRVWLPLQSDPADYPRRRGPEIFMFGRLAPGVSLAKAEAELHAIGQRTAEAFPDTNARLRPRIVRYASFWADDITRAEADTLQVIISLLLVVVGVNVAILVYARTATRHGEIVVRTALGASRTRIVRQLFIEALVLSAMATSAGLLVASAALGQIDAFLADRIGVELGGLPFWVQHRLSTGTMLYAAGLAMLAAVIAGVVPAWKATGRRVQSGLRDLEGNASLRLGRTWTTLIVAQVALAVAILPGGVYYAWQSIVQSVPTPGFAAEPFLTARLEMDMDVPPSAQAREYWRAFDRRYTDRLVEIVDRAKREPGVADVIPMMGIPGLEPGAQIEIEAGPSGQTVRTDHVDVRYFDVLGVPILAGRSFHAGDVAAATRSAVSDADGDGVADTFSRASTSVIVNRTFVREILGDGPAVGRRIRHVSTNRTAAESAPVTWYEIVGVVGDVHNVPEVRGETDARLYHPLVPGQIYPSKIAVRTATADPAAFAGRLREIVDSLDSSLRLEQVVPLVEVYRRDQEGQRMGALAFALVTMSVVLLSAAGIYALMSFTVTRRQREIGIRVALGAQPRRILSSIFTRAIGQVTIGVVVGMAAAVGLDQLIGQELMGGYGSRLLPVVAVLMIVVALLAAMGPARRGLRIQPTLALRDG